MDPLLAFEMKGRQAHLVHFFWVDDKAQVPYYTIILSETNN